jgi:DNA-binding transcriptional LysR family regulator
VRHPLRSSTRPKRCASANEIPRRSAARQHQCRFRQPGIICCRWCRNSWPSTLPLSVDLVFTDQVVDLIEERADIAIRVAPGPLRGNQLMARKIGESAVAVVASPDYVARHGEPKTPADLAKHNLIGFNFARSVEGWPFRLDGALISIAAVGNTQVGDGEIARQLAVAGIGLARLGRFHVEAEIAAGRLVTVLEDFNPGDIEVIHAVYLGQGGFVPARMRAFIDFLARNVKIRA